MTRSTTTTRKESAANRTDHAPACADQALAGTRLGEGGQRFRQVGGEREYDGRAALARDVVQGREVAQLHGLRHRGQDLAGLDQLLRRLLLALGIDDLGAADALGLRLLGDG